MKITPHNTSINDKTSTNQSLSKRLESQNNSPIGSKAKPLAKNEDSVVINENELSKSTKEINNTIGALQIAIKGMNKISQDAETLLKNSKEIHSKNSQVSQTALKESENIKSDISKIFDTSTFGGENVFSKKYSLIEPKIKFQANSINPDRIEIKNTKNLADFIKDLNLQKKYAKEAIETLSDKVGNVLPATDEKYEALDKNALNKDQFKASHNTEGITLERLTKLLG
ncbi:hypothetical protein [Helicobacter cappadocius]|uniref:Uncharacterized protein n=1 Tax=Helicobacter cappadocius TaxID=3063998 RepID=A0AA90Q2W7_9HELI|nr:MULTISPECIES: hypothetical protein [unclassified Helicobacter]MDO7253219.1 hypothetical protein [Helicobacter sp. faydin-H75]MDP2539143.1 hypothetical protein [Helicobacter sp. faydin-H76]